MKGTRMPRDAYREGIKLLLQLQLKLEHPPKRNLIKGLVQQLVKEAGLRDDKREHYFQLLATCALMGTEPLYNNYKPRRKHASTKERG